MAQRPVLPVLVFLCEPGVSAPSTKYFILLYWNRFNFNVLGKSLNNESKFR